MTSLTVVPAPLSALAPVSSRHFIFVYELKTQEEARSYCRQHYTDLATVENMEDVLTLNEMVDRSRLQLLKPPDGFLNGTWIGLYDDVNTWSWSLSDPTYYSEGQENYRNWAPGRPNNIRANQFCVWMYQSGQWEDYECTYRLQAICVNLTGSSETFVLTTASFTWEEAQQYCRQHHTDLASVKNATQNSQIAALIPTNSAWIGLNRQRWRWLDGNNSTFSFWKTLQPDNYETLEHCVVADFESGGRWADSNCDKMRPFICYGWAVKKYKIKLQLNTTIANLNDPVVMEQLLQQIALRVGRANATDLLKLSWVKDANGNVFNKTTTP
ncbi:C-type mannose receptor 2-like [Boleophthalmus pectinirostris]|uniref:C-type mannose receptor 2-like n=1 Tax=Boleophthalmus pectinirostris TaxID=150288 RepID=UPI00242DEA54|nr:C-type mannose receptor 2-like [Boleophthalmus pectinirostris]